MLGGMGGPPATMAIGPAGSVGAHIVGSYGHLAHDVLPIAGDHRQSQHQGLTTAGENACTGELGRATQFRPITRSAA